MICTINAINIDNLPLKISCATNETIVETLTHEWCIIEEHFQISNAFDFSLPNADQWKNASRLGITNNQQMKIFPKNVFHQMPYLANLTITANVEIISSDCFIGANELIELYFTENNIERLPANLLADAAHKLEIFKFPVNKVKVVEPFTFNGTVQLRYIGMNGNKLNRIERDTFTGAINLEALNLLGNQIETIEDEALNFPKLSALDLSYNRLQQLSDTVFVNLPEIMALRITNNRLIQIGRSLEPLVNLVGLALSKNVIDDLDLAAVLQHPKLTVAELDDSGLLSVNTIYQPNVTYAIEFLDISHNGIPQRDILRRLGSCGKLKKLRVSGNRYISMEQLYEARSRYFPLLTEATSTHVYTF